MGGGGGGGRLVKGREVWDWVFTSRQLAILLILFPCLRYCMDNFLNTFHVYIFLYSLSFVPTHHPWDFVQSDVIFHLHLSLCKL